MIRFLSRWPSWLAATSAAVVTGSVVWGLTEAAVPTPAVGSRPAADTVAPTLFVPPPVTAPSIPTARVPQESPEAGAVVSPSGLTIPALTLDLPVSAVGVRADGQMDVPADPEVVGWYRFGASPADDQGAVVMAAHVDSAHFGIGPFARLADIPLGSPISVEANGRAYAYRTESVQQVEKSIMAPESLFDRGGPPRLHLVTCGGSFDQEAGWDSNVVVVASRVH